MICLLKFITFKQHLKCQFWFLIFLTKKVWHVNTEAWNNAVTLAHEYGKKNFLIFFFFEKNPKNVCCNFSGKMAFESNRLLACKFLFRLLKNIFFILENVFLLESKINDYCATCNGIHFYRNKFFWVILSF